MEKNEDSYVQFEKTLKTIVYGHMLALKIINKMGKDK